MTCDWCDSPAKHSRNVKGGSGTGIKAYACDEHLRQLVKATEKNPTNRWSEKAGPDQ